MILVIIIINNFTLGNLRVNNEEQRNHSSHKHNPSKSYCISRSKLSQLIKDFSSEIHKSRFLLPFCFTGSNINRWKFQRLKNNRNIFLQDLNRLKELKFKWILCKYFVDVSNLFNFPSYFLPRMPKLTLAFKLNGLPVFVFNFKFCEVK